MIKKINLYIVKHGPGEPSIIASDSEIKGDNYSTYVLHSTVDIECPDLTLEEMEAIIDANRAKIKDAKKEALRAELAKLEADDE
jgi:hypothetical protein